MLASNSITFVHCLFHRAHLDSIPHESRRLLLNGDPLIGSDDAELCRQEDFVPQVESFAANQREIGLVQGDVVTMLEVHDHANWTAIVVEPISILFLRRYFKMKTSLSKFYASFHTLLIFADCCFSLIIHFDSNDSRSFTSSFVRGDIDDLEELPGAEMCRLHEEALDDVRE